MNKKKNNSEEKLKNTTLNNSWYINMYVCCLNLIYCKMDWCEPLGDPCLGDPCLK